MPRPRSKAPARRYRWPACRVSTAFRQFDFYKYINDAAKKALAECEKRVELTGLANVVLSFVSVHREFLDWMQTESPSDAFYRWKDEHRKLECLLLTHKLLSDDHQKNEWDRWRDSLTTAERREILDVFWLAGNPLSNEQLLARLSNGKTIKVVAEMIKNVNKAAQDCNPPVKWMITWNPSTKTRSKRWTGKKID